MTGESASDTPGDAHQRPRSVFVSYSRKDKDRVAALVKTIEGLSHEVWWDDRLIAGARFTAETEDRLKAADFVVVIWTADSVRSEWVLDEAQVGKAAHKLVPLSFDGQEPPLGFRHVHTISFSNWSGDRTADCVLELARALQRPGGQTGAGTTAPIAPEKIVAKPQGRRMIAAAAIAGSVAALAIVAWLAWRVAPAPDDRVERALQALTRSGADERRAPVAQAALKAIENSGRAEDQAALASFGRGDATGALDILERLAADLERSGERGAAAEAYTRAAAIALMIDQGRGLASRRKAFELAPQSLPAFHGLIWDVYLLQGYEPARALAQSVVNEPQSSDALKALGLALLASISVDNSQDTQEAEDYLLRLKSINSRDDGPDVAAATAFVGYIVEWRQDRLADAAKSLAELSALVKKVAHPELYPVDVGIARIRYGQGDWDGLFDFSIAALKARERAGYSSPRPLLFITCLIGLYEGAGEEAASLCEAQARQIDSTGGARTRLARALALAVRGEAELAQREVAASRALAPDDTLLEIDRARIEVEIAAAQGNLDEAAAATWRQSDLLSGRANEKSRRAHAFRRLGTLAIRAGDPARACEPLRRSREIYAAIGGAPGATAVTALLAQAGCDA